MKIRPSSSSSQWYPHPHHHPHGHRHPHHHPHYHSNWAMKDSQKLAPNHPNHTLLLRWEQKLVKFYHQPFSRPKLAQSGGPFVACRIHLWTLGSFALFLPTETRKRPSRLTKPNPPKAWKHVQYWISQSWRHRKIHFIFHVIHCPFPVVVANEGLYRDPLLKFKTHSRD